MSERNAAGANDTRRHGAGRNEAPRHGTGPNESPRHGAGPSESPRHGAAVALAYREGEAAPRVLAKGNGLLAEAIIARAKSSGVFVHESPALVALLMQVDIDREIPPSLYVAVAQLLAWIYKLENNVNNDN